MRDFFFPLASKIGMLFYLTAQSQKGRREIFEPIYRLGPSNSQRLNL